MTADTKPEAEALCARCNYPRREHAYNGACYGLCSEFVTRAALSKPSVAADDEALIEDVRASSFRHAQDCPLIPYDHRPEVTGAMEALRRRIAELRAIVQARNTAIFKADAEITELKAALAACRDKLREIGDKAHDASTGPAVPDTLWEIRSMAYDAAQS